VVLHGDAAATDGEHRAFALWRLALTPRTGVAEYTELMTQGKVGVTYDIDVQCTTSDSGTLPLPLLHGAHELVVVAVFNATSLRFAPNWLGQETSRWGLARRGRRSPSTCAFASPARVMTSTWWLVACAARAPWVPSARRATASKRFPTGGACSRTRRAGRLLKHHHRFCLRRAANTSAVLFSCPLHSSCQSGPDAGDHACALGCVPGMRIAFSCG
jgi:hypothetical protein